MHTENILFEQLRLTDAQVVYEMTSNPKVARYMRFAAHTDRKQAETLIEEYTAKQNYAYLLYCKKTMEVVGVMAVKADLEEKGIYDLSAFSYPQFWRKGYFTEILAEVISFAKNTLDAKLLKGYVVEDNRGSAKVLERNGFQVTDTFQIDDAKSNLLVYTLKL